MSTPVGLRVVLADDEPHIRFMLNALLTQAGFNVVGEARSGREAIEQYRRHRPDLLLLDINMPNLTGEQALELIMLEDPTATVVMLTSLADAEGVDRCFRLGASHYMRKDTAVTELTVILLDAWRESRRGGTHE